MLFQSPNTISLEKARVTRNSTMRKIFLAFIIIIIFSFFFFSLSIFSESPQLLEWKCHFQFSWLLLVVYTKQQLMHNVIVNMISSCPARDPPDVFPMWFEYLFIICTNVHIRWNRKAPYYSSQRLIVSVIFHCWHKKKQKFFLIFFS